MADAREVAAAGDSPAAGATADEPTTLAGAFVRIQTLASRLDTMAGSDPQYEPLIAEGIRLGELAHGMLGDVYSSNETADDVNTADLKYLLLHYYLADFHQKSASGSRLRHIEAAQTLFTHFLSLCRRLELLKGMEALFDSSTAVDDRSRRTMKVSRFKQEKELKSKLQLLTARKARLMAKRGEDALAHDDGDDEELSREETIALLRLSAVRAADALDVLAQEADLLKAAEQLTDADRAEAIREREALNQLTRKMLTAYVPGERTRTEIQRGVFKYSHHLPKYTVEQAGEIEFEMHQQMQAAAAERARERQAAEKQLSAEQREDIETRKQRSWDDWKDEHPRGSGNMGGRRG